MIRYLLDSDICISFFKKKHKVSEKIYDVGTDNCFVSEITIAELKYGAEKSDNYAKHAQEVEEIRELFGVIPIIEHLDQIRQRKSTTTTLRYTHTRLRFTDWYDCRFG